MAIRVIVVGMGARGGDWVREIQKTPEFKLVACVDIDNKVNTITRTEFHIDLREALAATSADAVIIATPSDSHVESCRQALTQGVAVIVEKPFTTNLLDAMSLVSLAAKNNTPLIVAQNYRYMRSFRTARTLISQGVLGPIGLAMCQYYRVPHAMAASLARLTNSVLWGVAVHHLDMLRYVLNQAATDVLADSFSVPWGSLPNGASMRVMLTFDGGTRAVYTASYESSGHQFFERGQEFYARFVGARATLHIFQRWLLLCENGKLPRLIRRGSRKFTEEQVLLLQLRQALLSGEAPDASGLDNLQTMAIVEACIRSAEEKRWINPQELLNDFR